MKNPGIDLRKYIVISAWHACNNDCTICMLSDVKDKMPAMGFDLFRNVVERIADDNRFESLILSGAEITTFEALEKYVRFATSLGRFKKIQIQTNGRKLSDMDYVERLIDAGVNEFFISVHGLKQTHDAITRVPGSFDETMGGIRNLEDKDVNVMTNTVLNKLNYPGIPGLMTDLCQLPISEIHMWNFYPMESTDTRDLVVSMKEFLALLPKVLSIVEPSGKPLVLKSFPECLSIEEPGFFDSGYPETLIPDVFWKKFGENRFGTCVYKDQCDDWECWGLSGAYIEKYGDERGLLSPIKGQEGD